jgi:sterol desaturase/sphingolipid hydroxylase (fatty acid hydroxylase superfamily)
VRRRFGWLEWLIATPAFHHWHHTRSEHADRNYAAMLPWPDRLFGTYYMPKRAWPADYGTDIAVSPNMAVQLLHPILAAK